MINIAKIEKRPLKSWLVTWLINAAVLYLASLFYPEDIVLGNASLSSWLALMLVALIVTFTITQITSVLKILKLKLTNKWLISIVYGVVNIVVLWLVARTANYTGFGISSFFSAIILGVVLTILQYGVRLTLGRK